MGQVATVLVLVILLATIAVVVLLVRTALRRGGVGEGDAAGRVPRSLLVILAVTAAIIVVLTVSLRIAGAL
ncbi:MAG TPA: hypothetical protein VN193_03505 [Candidatus Angelobacter sp.]|jgi:hypothetical protein|nr:hypothetical protein [Candidatus Angelobacter sp.]